VLAVLLVGAHATARWWGPALAGVLFGDVPTPADAPPLLWALLACWLLIALTGGAAVGHLIIEGSGVRDRHRWQREWAVREQLRAMERQIREEAMSEEERAWLRQYRERQTAIRREARRRLGLPEEESP
jgi:hypothetical protein